MNVVKVRMLKMEPIKVRCKSCGKEIRAAAGKSVCCGCSNMTTIKGDVISAVDLSKVIMLGNYSSNKSKSLFSREELDWQEQRNRRRVRKLDFEVR